MKMENNLKNNLIFSQVILGYFQVMLHYSRLFLGYFQVIHENEEQPEKEPKVFFQVILGHFQVVFQVISGYSRLFISYFSLQVSDDHPGSATPAIMSQLSDDTIEPKELSSEQPSPDRQQSRHSSSQRPCRTENEEVLAKPRQTRSQLMSS